MIKLCKYLSTMWNRTHSRFVAGLINISDCFLCKADFILSRNFTLLHSRFVKPPDWIWELFKNIILTTGRDQETIKWEKKEFYSSAKHAWFARWHSIDSIYLSIILKYKLRQLSYFVLILNKLWLLWRYVTSLWFIF